VKQLFLAFACLPVAGCILSGGDHGPAAQLDVGTPTPQRFREVDIQGTTRGVVQHDLCVSADVPTGFIVPLALVDDGAYAPLDGAPLQPDKFTDLDCPDSGVAWARVEWDTVTGHGLMTLAHSTTEVSGQANVTPTGGGEPCPECAGGGGDDIDGGFGFEPDASWDFEPDAAWDIDASWDDAGFAAHHPVYFSSGSQVELTGTGFAGYDVTIGEPVFVSDFVESVPLHVDYRAVGDLAAAPAANVTVGMAWQPDISGYALGGSPGVDTSSGTFRTDVHGDAYLLVSTDVECSYLFAVTPDGGTSPAGSLACF
jgi:hypothetical protein